MHSLNIALFASGTGTNAINIIRFFEGKPRVSIPFLLCNKANAPVIEKALELGTRVIVLTNEEVADDKILISICQDFNIDYIVLAGYLRKIPTGFVSAYPEKIINIHPALLPKFGGEGMYGKFVHQAVLDAKETQTGITIHFVNEEYDKGRIIAQFQTDLNETETVDSIVAKIHVLEQRHFPQTLLNLFEGK